MTAEGSFPWGSNPVREDWFPWSSDPVTTVVVVAESEDSTYRLIAGGSGAGRYYVTRCFADGDGNWPEPGQYDYVDGRLYQEASDKKTGLYWLEQLVARGEYVDSSKEVPWWEAGMIKPGDPCWSPPRL